MRQESLFISDLHLTASRPEVVERFLNFCHQRATGAERLYILGDLFDAFIGDDNNDWPFNAIKASLKRLTGLGTTVFFLHGNRDFLLGDRFAEETGAQLLKDYEVIDLYGTPALVTHGDLLCTDDIQYQAARQRVRAPEWKANALGKPLWMRKLYARWYRYKSGRDKGAKTHEVMDVNADTVESVMREYGVNVLIHGHTHRPATHALIINGLSAQRVVLPEWDGKEWLLCWTTQGLKKEPL
jgi:UDP-2,3-diacylglucosamine hydrolase